MAIGSVQLSAASTSKRLVRSKRDCASKGRLAMIDFCREHEISHEICGKILVAKLEDSSDFSTSK